MLALVLQNNADCPLTNLRGKLVRRLAHRRPFLSGVRASGNPGAVHYSADLISSGLRAQCRNAPSIGSFSNCQSVLVGRRTSLMDSVQDVFASGRSSQLAGNIG